METLGEFTSPGSNRSRSPRGEQQQQKPPLPEVPRMPAPSEGSSLGGVASSSSAQMGPAGLGNAVSLNMQALASTTHEVLEMRTQRLAAGLAQTQEDVSGCWLQVVGWPRETTAEQREAMIKARLEKIGMKQSAAQEIETATNPEKNWVSPRTNVKFGTENKATTALINSINAGKTGKQWRIDGRLILFQRPQTRSSEEAGENVRHLCQLMGEGYWVKFVQSLGMWLIKYQSEEQALVAAGFDGFVMKLLVVQPAQAKLMQAIAMAEQAERSVWIYRCGLVPQIATAEMKLLSPLAVRKAKNKGKGKGKGKDKDGGKGKSKGGDPGTASSASAAGATASPAWDGWAKSKQEEKKKEEEKKNYSEHMDVNAEGQASA